MPNAQKAPRAARAQSDNDSRRQLARQLSVRHLLFAHALLDGATQAQAYVKAGFKAASEHVAHVSASRLLVVNSELRHYIELERARRLADADLTGAQITRALWLEAHDRSGTQGARVMALATLAKIGGIFQADRRNDADIKADLLRDIRCRFAIALHTARGVPLEEALRIADKDPAGVEAWARREGLLEARALPPGRELVVEEGETAPRDPGATGELEAGAELEELEPPA